MAPPRLPARPLPLIGALDAVKALFNQENRPGNFKEGLKIDCFNSFAEVVGARNFCASDEIGNEAKLRKATPPHAGPLGNVSV